MEQVVISIFILLFVLWEILVLDLVLRVSGNAEVDALNALKSSMSDPNNLIQSWDSTLVTPCQWDRVTCNAENSVIRVDLGDANLSGQLVPQLGQLQNLQYLELFSNNITGKIPDDLGSLINLVSLDLSLNNITGSIPDNLANLKKLRFLHLNNNSLSGKIPVSLTSVSSLQVLDLSNNNLTGDVPANGSFSFFTSTSFKNNPLLNQTVPTPPAPTLQQNPSAFNSHVNRAIVVAVGVALLFGVLVIPLVYWRRRKDYFFDVSAEEDPEVHLTQPRRFSLRDLQIATDNFHRKNLIGRGKFGMVYKGRLINGEPVAIKRLKQKHKYTERSLIHFQVELETTSMIVHPNLLRLRGFCMTPTERLLVHPFMVNGSVASSLRDRSESQPPLDWHKRKRIALGAARGLAYLHDHCDLMVIHRDVKASNIFLDEENEAVVGDFGLIRLMNHKDTHVTSPVCGTIGHIPPEYLSSGKTSEKTDVFGYGMTLLEIITGRRAFDLARLADDDDLLFLDWIKVLKDKRLETLVDADLEGNFEEKEVKELIQVALLCIQSSPLKRPKMSEVVRMLEGEGLAEKWNKWLQNEDIIQQNLYIVDMNSTSNISPEEPSGPMIFELEEIV